MSAARARRVAVAADEPLPDPKCAVVTTYVFFGRPVLARVLWSIAGPLHRRVARYLMERAAAAAHRAGSPAQ